MQFLAVVPFGAHLQARESQLARYNRRNTGLEANNPFRDLAFPLLGKFLLSLGLRLLIKLEYTIGFQIVPLAV